MVLHKKEYILGINWTSKFTENYKLHFIIIYLIFYHQKKKYALLTIVVWWHIFIVILLKQLDKEYLSDKIKKNNIKIDLFQVHCGNKLHEAHSLLKIVFVSVKIMIFYTSYVKLSLGKDCIVHFMVQAIGQYFVQFFCEMYYLSVI